VCSKGCLNDDRSNGNELAKLSASEGRQPSSLSKMDRATLSLTTTIEIVHQPLQLLAFTTYPESDIS
jgi:hypothetical protein